MSGGFTKKSSISTDKINKLKKKTDSIRRSKKTVASQRQVRHLNHTRAKKKPTRTPLKSSFPSKTDGRDGDERTLHYPNRGLYNLKKINGEWYANKYKKVSEIIGYDGDYGFKSVLGTPLQTKILSGRTAASDKATLWNDGGTYRYLKIEHGIRNASRVISSVNVSLSNPTDGEAKTSITADTIAAANSNPDSFTDSGSGFVTAGFKVGQAITVTGFANSVNNSTFRIDAVTAGTLTLSIGASLTLELEGRSVTIVASTSGFDTSEILNGTTSSPSDVFEVINSGSSRELINYNIRRDDYSIWGPLAYQNTYYTTGYAGVNFGTSVGTESVLNIMKGNFFTAVDDMIIDKIAMTYYWIDSTLSGDETFEINLWKATPVDDDNTSIAVVEIPMETSNALAGVVTENTVTSRIATFNPITSSVSAGDVIILTVRITSGNPAKMSIYGTATLQAYKKTWGLREDFNGRQYEILWDDRFVYIACKPYVDYTSTSTTQCSDGSHNFNGTTSVPYACIAADHAWTWKNRAVEDYINKKYKIEVRYTGVEPGAKGGTASSASSGSGRTASSRIAGGGEDSGMPSL